MKYRIAAIATLIFLNASAQADVIVTMRLDAGPGTVVTIGDNSALDMSAIVGEIVYMGAVGGFTTTVSTGISAPSLGSEEEPILHLNSVEITSLSAAAGGFADSITIALTGTGFTAPIGNTHFGLAIGGIAAPGVIAATIAADGFLDTGNTAFGMTTPLGHVDNGGSAGPFASSTFGPVAIGSSPYSLSLFTTVVHTQLGQTSSFDAEIRIPEPSALAIFGIGLLSLGFSRKRKQARI